jgi:hypothetical protein
VVLLSTLPSALALPPADPDAPEELPGLPASVPVEVPAALLALLTSPLGILALDEPSAAPVPLELPGVWLPAVASDFAFADSRTVVEAGGVGVVAGGGLTDRDFVTAGEIDAFVAIGALVAYRSSCTVGPEVAVFCEPDLDMCGLSAWVAPELVLERLESPGRACRRDGALGVDVVVGLVAEADGTWRESPDEPFGSRPVKVR